VRLDSGVAVKLEEIPIRAFLEELVAETASDAEDKGIKVHLECSIESVVADPKLLHSAMANLVRNAVKFTRRDGAVQLRVHRAQRRVLLLVEDECGGLADGQMDQLFEPFVQVGRDRSGFGLGLAIAKQATDAHGGALRANNIPGHGCVFVLDLPEEGVAEPGA
jgi:signal transduction histidine kinase